MLVTLSIAGFDPSGGAGVLADIKTFSAFGCFGTAAITSLTSQDTTGVYGAFHQSAEVLRAQIEPVASDFRISAVKVGMLPTREVIEVVAETIERHELPNVVVDTVLRATSGYDLSSTEATNYLVERLLPLADVITPNLAEAGHLTGLEVTDLQGMKHAARRIYEMCSARTSKPAARHAVLVKGGHLSEEATDLLFDQGEFHLFRAPKIVTQSTHGTGCTLSSAIAAALAQGCDVRQAVTKAKQYLAAGLLSAPNIGSGAGPLNHAVNGFDGKI